VRRLLAVALLWSSAAGAADLEDWRPALEKTPDGTPVVVLNLSPCRVREAEPRAVPLAPATPGACEVLNRASLPVRERAFKRLRLPAGRYVFRVFNADVAWPIGFEIRGATDAALPKTKGEDIRPGTGKDFLIDLKPGRYLYRCPLSPTPDYPLLVEG
jgi:hypothetical protein